MLIGLTERFLGQILGYLRPAHHSQDRSVDQAAVSAHEAAEGLCFASQRLADERPVV